MKSRGLSRTLSTSDCSERVAQMLGLPPGRHRSFDAGEWGALIHPEDRERVEAAARAGLWGAEGRYRAEFRMRRADGEWIWVLSRGKAVVRAPEGAPLRAAGTLSDVTQRRRAEDTLRSTLDANQRLVVELQHALQQVKTLSGLLPVCMFCKKVRNDQGYWARIEQYLAEHADVEVSHGVCPDCGQKFLGDDVGE